MEQVHLAAEAAVVALGGLLQPMEVRVEIGLLGEGRAVDARQHRLGRIAAPIGAGHLHQLERGADLARARHVRAAAEVEPVALPVDLQILAGRNGVDEFDLEGLALLLEEASRLIAAPDLLGEGPVARDDLAHLRFDRGEVLGRERRLAIEIVVEAVVDHRADGDLRARIEASARPRRARGPYRGGSVRARADPRGR